MARRKIPLRRCIGCGQRQPKQSMIRVVKSPDDTLSVDASGKKSGRGCYLCPDTACLTAVFSGDKLARALRMGTIDHQMKATLKQELVELIENDVDEARR